MTTGEDVFGGVRRASGKRRLLAAGLDALAALGAPWIVLVLTVPFLLPFVELVLVVVPALTLSAAAAGVIAWARRLPNGDSISPGQLAAGLTVLRTDTEHRIVLAADVHGPRRPARPRVIAARVAVAVAALVGVAAASGAGLLAYAVVFQTQNQAAAEAQWAAQESDALKVRDEFKWALVSDLPGGGEDLVTGDAAAQLPEYLATMRREGVTGFEEQGYGQSGGVWDFQYLETGPLDPGSPARRSVTFRVESKGGRFLVTRISRDGP